MSKRTIHVIATEQSGQLAIQSFVDETHARVAYHAAASDRPLDRLHEITVLTFEASSDASQEEIAAVAKALVQQRLAPQSLSAESLYGLLCDYDPRNPMWDKTSKYYEPEDRRLPRLECGCDNCFYGRDRLATEILRLRAMPA